MTDRRWAALAELYAERPELNDPDLWSTLKHFKFLNFMFWVALLPALYFTFSGHWIAALTFQLWLVIICALRLTTLVSLMPLTQLGGLLHKILKQLRAAGGGE